MFSEKLAERKEKGLKEVVWGKKRKKKEKKKKKRKSKEIAAQYITSTSVETCGTKEIRIKGLQRYQLAACNWTKTTAAYLENDVELLSLEYFF